MNPKHQIHVPKRVAIFSHPFFIFFILCFLTPLCSFGSFDFSTELEKAYQEFLKLKVDKGQKIVQESLKKDPANGIAIYLENYGEAISLFISENQSQYDLLKKNEDLRLKKIAKLSKSSPYYLFTQAEIKMQWAFVKLKFGDEVSAVWNVRAALKLLEENKKLFPDFVPTNKTLGLLNIMIGSIPDKYASLAGMVGLKGDIQKGLDLLKSVEESSTIYVLEAGIYRVLAESFILKKSPVDYASIQSLHEKHKDNLLLSFMQASILLKNARTDESLATLQARPSGSEYIPFPYLDYITAEIYLFKAQYALSREYYFKFLKNYTGKNLIKDTYYKILLTHWLSNEEESARLYLDKISKNGNTLYDADKHAQKFAEKGEMPERILMKSRLYFDGGYYAKALEAINAFDSKEPHPSKDLIEFYYRKGRIYHLMNNTSNASLYYLKTIELSKNVNYYFAPNAALQMGYIYKQQNNRELAKVYFQKALSYQNYEYKNSIDNKARAALNEMK